MAALERSSTGEPDALLKDLYEKKQNLRRIASEVGSMASELREVRGRMAAQGATLEQEAARRQSAEAKAKSMEREMELLQKNLETRSSQALTSASVAEQYLWELVDVRAKLGATQAAADECSASAILTQSESTTLLKEIEKKNEALQEHENRMTRLGQHLFELQKEFKQREISQNQLRNEVERIEAEIMLSVAKLTTNTECELKRLWEEVSMKNTEQLVKHLSAKDEETARLREEFKLTSTQLKLKNQELDVQLDKQRRSDQELQKRVNKLEFCLQEARSQTRKLQRISEKRDKEIKDLRSQQWLKEAAAATPKATSKFWGSTRFRIFLSVSVVVLVFLAKR